MRLDAPNIPHTIVHPPHTIVHPPHRLRGFTPTFFLALPPDLFTGSLSFLADFPASFFFLSSLGGCRRKAGMRPGHKAAPNPAQTPLPEHMGEATALPSPHVARQLCEPSADAAPNARRHRLLPEPRQFPLHRAHHSEGRRTTATTAASLRCRTKRKWAPRASSETSGRSDCFRDKGRSRAEEVRRHRLGSGPELATEAGSTSAPSLSRRYP